MSAELAGILAEHQTEQLWKPGGWAGDTACSCGWRMAMWDRKEFPDVHRAHVAQVLAEWVGGEKARAWDEGASFVASSPTGLDRKTWANPYRLDPREGA